MYFDYSKDYSYEKSMWEYSLAHNISPRDVQETVSYKKGIVNKYYLTIGYISLISIFALFSSVRGIVIDYKRLN